MKEALLLCDPQLPVTPELPGRQCDVLWRLAAATVIPCSETARASLAIPYQSVTRGCDALRPIQRRERKL